MRRMEKHAQRPDLRLIVRTLTSRHQGDQEYKSKM